MTPLLTSPSHNSVEDVRLYSSVPDDARLTSWRSGSTPKLPAPQILAAAAQKLLSSGGVDRPRATPLSITAAFGILYRLVSDDSATPQIAHHDDGDIEINWMVSGDWVQVLVEPDGSIELRAAWSDGTDEIDTRFQPSSVDVRDLDRARIFLAKISRGVNYRAAF